MGSLSKLIGGPSYVYFNGQTFSSVLNSFLLSSKFFGLRMQKSTFC